LPICSLYTFCLGCKAISLQAARLLIVLHPKPNVYSAPKRQTVRFCEALKCCSSVKGLGFKFQVER